VYVLARRLVWFAASSYKLCLLGATAYLPIEYVSCADCVADVHALQSYGATTHKSFLSLISSRSPLRAIAPAGFFEPEGKVLGEELNGTGKRFLSRTFQLPLCLTLMRRVCVLQIPFLTSLLIQLLTFRITILLEY